MFISKYYAKKLWTNHERRNAQARAFESNKEYILPVRFDNTKITGILPTTGYLNLSTIPPRKLAELIKEKIGRKLRKNFIPDDFDKLFEQLSITDSSQQAEIHRLVDLFFGNLELMTEREREVLFIASINSCPSGPPENIHINLDYLSRIVKMSKNEIISLFSRLECLQFRFTISRGKGNRKRKSHLHSEENLLTIKFEPTTVSFTGNATFIVYEVFKCIESQLCPNCASDAVKRLDFSILSSFAGFPEKH